MVTNKEQNRKEVQKQKQTAGTTATSIYGFGRRSKDPPLPKGGVMTQRAVRADCRPVAFAYAL